MAYLPYPIELERTSNEGFTYDRTEREINQELIEKFNELLEYIKENLIPLV